jgi:pimeloyl-ACP methyl ester carboxylesterase
MNATCVSFTNSRGQRLHGILHEPPPATARGVCVLLLSPGIKGRVGPHRLYLKLAERLVPMGFHVLRFDFYGLGDSEGELDEERLADVYNAIQLGRYVDDTLAAMDWTQASLGIGQFVGSGLCGGSITALFAAIRDPRIRSLLGIGLPVVLDGGEANRGRFLTTQQTESARREFYGRLLHPSRWVKFLTGRSNYRVVWRVLRQAFHLPGGDATAAAPAVEGGIVDDTNPLFAQAILGFLRSKRPALLVYSGGDRIHSQFQEKFEARHRPEIAALGRAYDVHVVAEANHILSDAPWTEELLDVAQEWLGRVHPA